MLELLFTSPLAFIVLAFSLVVAITIHEFSHAWVADKLGDPTPGLAGRITLNPLAHLDPMGTLALLLVGFGWGKPVPIDSYNLRDPKRDGVLISLAGPGSNLILAVLLSLILKFLGVSFNPLISFILVQIIALNITLAIFNLLPIPPLDGSHILLGLLPNETAYNIEESLSRYGIILLIFVLFPIFGSQSLASLIISPIINFVVHLLL